MSASSTGTAVPEAGLASVATVSFLASRAAPSAGFVIALAGGTAMARAGQRLGARRGYGASIAAMLESVAIIGPARFGVPLTQAATAPMVGALDARGVHPFLQGLACFGVRLLHNTLSTAFFIWVILGGLDAYAGSYDALTGPLGGAPGGEAGALALTAAGLLAWGLFASVVQVSVYRRGLAAWPQGAGAGAGEREQAGAGVTASAGGVDPRAAAVAAVVAFSLLVASTAWVVLAGVCAWLALVGWSARGIERTALLTGIVLAAAFGVGALAATLIAGLGAEVAARRALRAVLLVTVATWLRGAAGSDGLREVGRRSLLRLHRLPAMTEAAAVLDRLGSDRRLLAAGRALLDSLEPVRKRPLPVLDAVLGWVASESGRFAPEPARSAARLSARPLDALLVVSAALPAAGLALA